MITGLGYVSTVFLPGCVGAGLELVVSALMIYNTYCFGEYPLWEFISLPLADYSQIGGQLFYISQCTYNRNLVAAQWYVSINKLVQGVLLPFHIQTAISNIDTLGAPFMFGFEQVKMAFNVIQGTAEVITLAMS
mmetsp:Transcript_14101/g.10154  ORF Transcript_14101/g.10154 Transcript_14101/m.10154 type:complete len:134 (+) Transcript_14101:322-723(+)